MDLGCGLHRILTLDPVVRSFGSVPSTTACMPHAKVAPDPVHTAASATHRGTFAGRPLISAVKTLATTDSLLFPESIRELSRHHSTPTTRELPELTAREGDVLRGLSRGLNNAEIAEELYVGIETVKTHVGSLLGKLGARDRTQAVIAAYESGFISLR